MVYKMEGRTHTKIEVTEPVKDSVCRFPRTRWAFWFDPFEASVFTDFQFLAARKRISLHNVRGCFLLHLAGFTELYTTLLRCTCISRILKWTTEFYLCIVAIFVHFVTSTMNFKVLHKCYSWIEFSYLIMIFLNIGCVDFLFYFSTHFFGKNFAVFWGFLASQLFCPTSEWNAYL